MGNYVDAMEGPVELAKEALKDNGYKITNAILSMGFLDLEVGVYVTAEKENETHVFLMKPYTQLLVDTEDKNVTVDVSEYFKKDLEKK